MANALARVHLLVSGRVQGVGYRYSTKVMATQLALTGWVKNLADGRVEAIAEGPREKLESLVAWAKQGPSSARVEDVAATWSDATGEFSAFGVAR